MAAPFVVFYVLTQKPGLKIPLFIAAGVLAIFLVGLKSWWKDRYQLKITSASIVVQVNEKLPPMEFAYSQVARFTLHPFVDGMGQIVSKLSLFDSSKKMIFSIKVINQSEQVWEFLEAWQQALPVEVKIVSKNGILYAAERLGEILGGFNQSTNVARIDFINHAHLP